MESDILACDVAVFPSSLRLAGGKSYRLAQVRQALHYTRAFTPREIVKHAQFFLAGEAAVGLFDPTVPEVVSLRQRCLVPAASAGIFNWLVAFEVDRPDNLMEALSAPQLAYQSARSDMLRVCSKKQFVEHFSGVLAAVHAVLGSLQTWFRWLSAWPLFGVLGLLAQHLRTSWWQMDTSSPWPKGRARAPILNGTWDSWLESGQWRVPNMLYAFASNFMLAPPRDVCSMEASAAIVAKTVFEFGAEKAIGAVAPWIWGCLTTRGLLTLLEPEWAAFWQGLDRLTTSQRIVVNETFSGPDGRIEPELRRRLSIDHVTSTATFGMHLLPPHILGLRAADRGYWFIADRIRFTGKAHCNPAFVAMAEAIALRSGGGQGLNLVEIGAHMGDCCLWAAARWRTGIRCLAVEAEPLHAGLIRKSIRTGGYEEAIQVVQVCVVAEGWCPPAPGPNAATTLDCVLGRWSGSPDLVSLYLGELGAGNEWGALQGALATLRLGPGRQPSHILVRARKFGARDLAVFMARHRLPYRVLVVREGFDLLLVAKNSSRVIVV